MRFIQFLTLAVLLSVVNVGFARNTSFISDIVVEDAAWCWFSDPRAVFYKGVYEKIYYGYINSKGDVKVKSYNLRTKEEDEFILHEKLQIDDHNVPTFLFLPDGKMLVFYNEHSGSIYMRKSKEAESIAAWEDEVVLLEKSNQYRYCYVNPVMLSNENNRIYLFGRNIVSNKLTYSETKIYCIYSDDYGDTWSDEINIFDNAGRNSPQYVKYTTDHKSRIDFLFTDGHPRHGDISVYHMYYKDGHFRQTNGEIISSFHEAPVIIKTVNKVYDAEKSHIRAWIWDIALDKKQNPVLTYTRYPTYMEHEYYYARWTGDNWKHVKVTNAGNYITNIKPGKKLLEQHYSGGIVLDHYRPDVVYLSRKIGGKFELEKRRIDKSGKQRIYSITKHSKKDQLRPYVVNNTTNGAPILLWMSGDYYHYTDYNTNLNLKFY
jgi:hypothetical protein